MIIVSDVKGPCSPRGNIETEKLLEESAPTYMGSRHGFMVNYICWHHSTTYQSTALRHKAFIKMSYKSPACGSRINTSWTLHQAAHAAPHVGVADCQPDANSRRYHRPDRALTTAAAGPRGPSNGSTSVITPRRLRTVANM